MRVVIVTMDSHLAGALTGPRGAGAPKCRACARLHVAADWTRDAATVERCRADIARYDIVVCAMLFLEEQFARSCLT